MSKWKERQGTKILDAGAANAGKQHCRRQESSTQSAGFAALGPCGPQGHAGRQAGALLGG